MKPLLFFVFAVIVQICKARNVTNDGHYQRATCTPDVCVNNYVRGKIYEFQRWVIDEEGDEPLSLPMEYSRRLTTVFSDTTINFSGGVLTGMYSRMPVSSGSVSSNILGGNQYVYFSSRQVALRGFYSVSGTVLGNPIDTYGGYEIYCDIVNYGYTYYTVNSDGTLNVTRSTFYTNLNLVSNSFPTFQNFLESGDAIRPVLTKYFAENILSIITTPLSTHTAKFKNFMAMIFQGKSLTALTTWDEVPSSSTNPPTIPTTTEPPLFSCLPDSCIATYYRNELNGLKQYAVQNGLERVAINRTFTNRTLTTAFDLDITYGDIVVENFFSVSSSPTIYHYMSSGQFQAIFYSDLVITGNFTGHGTILGEPASHSGRWSGKIRQYLGLTYRYTLTNGFEELRVNTPSLYTSSATPSEFSTDLFDSLHALKQPFDTLVQTQLSTRYRATWIPDFYPYMREFFNEKLSVATFQQLIKSQLPATTPVSPTTPTPRPTTPSTPSPPFQCEPDGCLLDYVRLKISRFSDWVDSANRDPLILPGIHRVQFAIWDIDLYLENITVYGYLPTFFNSINILTSDCLSGTITLETRSPTLQIYGKYNSTGTLEEYSLTKSGDWRMNVSIRSTTTLTYRIDNEGFISELRGTFSTFLLTRSGVIFENFIDASQPLAQLLLEDIATRASTLVPNQIRTFMSLIIDFMNILLTEYKFYDIITWHRYGNQTTDPPVECSRNAKSSVSLNNWYIPIFGHTPLTIRGSRLDILQKVECRFHDVTPTVVAATVLNLNSATCDVPYLYQTGRIPVEVILTYPNGCEQVFEEIIFSAKPDDINLSLNASVASDAQVELIWNPGHLEAESLQLNVAELSHDSGTWIYRGILISSLPNTGSYSGLAEDLNILSSLTSGFVVFLTADQSQGTAIYSDVLYTDYGKTSQYFVESCQSWYETDPGPPTNLEPCPPLLTQAWIDSRFEYEWELQDHDTLQYFHPGGEHSFRQLIPNSDGSGSQCVYKNGEILVGGPGGGTADWASANNRTGYINHHIWDVYLWYICCGFNKDPNSCRKYYERRPSDDGTTYVPPPRPGNGEGDPHMTTFDGVSYTFNGVGEFFMIKNWENLDLQFEMQARMSQFVDSSTGSARNASAFTSFAFKETKALSESLIQLQISTAESGKGVVVLVNQTMLEIPTGFSYRVGKPFVTQTQEGGSLAVFFDGEGTIQHVFLSFSTGFSFNISSGADLGALNIISFAPSGQRGQGYTGLLGSFDGVQENDLTFPGGTALPLNASLRDIHNEFGLKWRTTAAESIFTYDFGKTHASYQQPGFTPNFEEPTFEDHPEAGEICGESKQCLYDFVSTGSVDFAKNTKQFQEDFEETSEIIEETVTMCSPLENPVEGWFSVDNYIAGSVARFFCNPEFVIDGSDSITCGSDGTWDNEKPECVSALGFDCSDKPDGYYADASDCSKYFGCLRGALREYMCPFPMRFDSIRLTCVPANSAVCA